MRQYYNRLAAEHGPPRALASEIPARNLISLGRDEGTLTEASRLPVLA